MRTRSRSFLDGEDRTLDSYLHASFACSMFKQTSMSYDRNINDPKVLPKGQSATRKWKNVVRAKESNKHMRYFAGGFVHNVGDADINTPSHYENSETFNRLIHQPDPRTSTKLGTIEQSRNREIRPS